MADSNIYGIDSLTVCSQVALDNASSSQYLGQKPAFWGRYFYAPGQIDSSGRQDSHYSAAENDLLRGNGIRLLPLARQTGNVHQADRAENDAMQNVAAILDVFPAHYLAGADPNILIFLDVEITNPMTSDYYSAWSDTLMSYGAEATDGTVAFKPALYAGTKDNTTWQALSDALTGNAKCFGIMIDRYYYGSPISRGWVPEILTPAARPTPPILAWQYWASPDDAELALNFDTNIASPFHYDMLMDGLIMPPGQAALIA